MCNSGQTRGARRREWYTPYGHSDWRAEEDWKAMEHCNWHDIFISMWKPRNDVGISMNGSHWPVEGRKLKAAAIAPQRHNWARNGSFLFRLSRILKHIIPSRKRLPNNSFQPPSSCCPRCLQYISTDKPPRLAIQHCLVLTQSPRVASRIAAAPRTLSLPRACACIPPKSQPLFIRPTPISDVNPLSEILLLNCRHNGPRHSR